MGVLEQRLLFFAFSEVNVFFRYKNKRTFSSQALLKEFRQTNPKSGVIDLKAYYRAAKYFEETIKRLPKKPDPILLEQIFGHIATLGAIHNQKSCFSDA